MTPDENVSPPGSSQKNRIDVGVVIATIGRAHKLDLVFESLAAQSYPPHEIVVVDQSSDREIAQLIESWTNLLPLRYIPNDDRGVAKARNAGWRALVDSDIVSFPDDDVVFAPDTLELMVKEFCDPSVLALSGRLAGKVRRVAFGDERTEINRHNVWTKSIEAVSVFRRDVLVTTSGFDETLGTGGVTPWQSGEGSELLLRVMKRGRVIYEPSIVLTEHMDGVGQADYLEKVRRYARGTGRVYRMHYSRYECIVVVIRPVVATLVALLRGDKKVAALRWQSVLGRVEGMLPTQALLFLTRSPRP